MRSEEGSRAVKDNSETNILEMRQRKHCLAPLHKFFNHGHLEELRSAKWSHERLSVCFYLPLSQYSLSTGRQVISVEIFRADVQNFHAVL